MTHSGAFPPQAVPRSSEWLESLASQPGACRFARLTINGALGDFVYSQNNNTADLLEMPAHAFGLDCHLWLISIQQALPPLRFRQFLHGATIWAGLLRILAGRITVAGVDSSFVTEDFVAGNLERLLQTIQGELDLTSDAIGEHLLMLIGQQLSCISATPGSSVQSPTAAGGRASNRISAGGPGDALTTSALRQQRETASPI